ncbi:hypothetical protein RJD24_15550 [Bacillaceae bacterium IKA-2]|nr:hypothetical protein RJD24_15550 [Bacillaceae bacterium IKA-2]
MKKTFNKKFNREVYEIFAGDYYATNERKIALTTLLGSCISVCLKDTISGIVAMNHFMLPAAIKRDEFIISEDARYGMYAMEKMINDMMKLGARKSGLQAKVFGGGEVLGTNINNVSKSNIEFAMRYLKMEEIPIISYDVSGKFGRKLFFVPETFDVFVKKIGQATKLAEAVRAEENYLEKIKRRKAEKAQSDANLTLFD